ncbi:MAG: twin-arginine translocase subunit TatC [Verrucomicrobiae bacterium]|nr:twin-arginine translocase subunit TatC [Verrucomicrobiae bacterium]
MANDDKHGPGEDDELNPEEENQTPSGEDKEGSLNEGEDLDSSKKDESNPSGDGADDSGDQDSDGDDDSDEPEGYDDYSYDSDDGEEDYAKSSNDADEDDFEEPESDGDDSDEENEPLAAQTEDLDLRHEDEDIALLDEVIEEGHMTFLEHLEELRGVLFKCAGSFLLAFILVAVFFRKINAVLRIPLDRAMNNHGIDQVVVTTTPFGIFSYLLQMGFLGALAISSPFILYFATTFVAPGLTTKEKRALLPGILMALVLLSMGSAFSYFILIPSALNVSIYLNDLLGVSLMWSVDRYMNLLLWMVLGVGLIFEFPLVIAILVFVGVLTVEQLRNFRRYAIVIMFVLAAFVTPTQDPFTMLLMAIPLCLLYEGSIIVSNFIEKKRKKEYEAEFGSWDEDDERRD